MGLVVGPDRVGRGLLQNRQGRLGTQVTAQTAPPNHQLQPVHRQRAGTEHCGTRTAGQDRSRLGSMALQHLQYRLRVAVPIWVHCPAHGTQVFRVLQSSGGRTKPALGLRSRNPDRNPNPNRDRNRDQPRPSPTNPRLAWRGGVWHLLMVEVPCVPSSPFRRSG